MADEYLADDSEANIHGQTSCFGPHRRVVAVRRAGGLLLATDGLSTPWVGVPDKENGIECEICLDLAGTCHLPGREPLPAKRRADALLEIGDFAAGEYRSPEELAVNGPMLAFRLGVDFAPAIRFILAIQGAAAFGRTHIEGLPFGAIRLLAATPVTEEDLADLDFSDDTHAASARVALSRHRARR